MKAVLQRVKYASVSVDGEVIGECREGLLILLGVAEGDAEEDARLLCAKILKLRIFCDENGKMNLSLLDIGGELLIVSQFTLLADYRHGNRPDFLASAKPSEAKRLYEYFISLAKESVKNVGTGSFGADMQVSLLNDGPVTIVMESKMIGKGKAQ